jgi:gluconate 5-dehydrogenase
VVWTVWQAALITGASRGLGREMALALAEAGADIVITGRTQNTLDDTAIEIRALGRQAWPIKTDMAIPEECQATCERILEEIGPIDILVNNVGNRDVNVAIQDESLAAWRSSIDLNLTSCFLSTKIIGASMVAQGHGGRIINIASISALIANRGIGGRDYETSKAAVLHFTRRLGPPRHNGKRHLSWTVHDRCESRVEPKAPRHHRGLCR